MASLTHVCMWSENGWKRVTAEQAAKLHQGGTVSAHSGLFMCELCGQYVTLTAGTKKTRHFRHCSYEKSKNCPERVFGADYSTYHNPQKHDLPIRITCVSSSSFRFEVGLIRVPVNLLSRNFSIEIKPKGYSDEHYAYVFTKERLNCNSITYLPIGERPFEKYTLNFINGSDELREFWPIEVNGIDPEGTLFEKTSGRKLTYDADVEIEKEYYLLKRGDRKAHSGIRIQCIAQKKFGLETWTLYVVSASAFCEEAARFFLDFHCRLTDRPISLLPVWPLFVEGDYMIKHNQDNMYVLVEGNVAAVKAFPSKEVNRMNNNAAHPKLYKIVSSSRQQLITAGRTQVLQYTYFWKEPLNQVGLPPAIIVTDLSGYEIAPGETNTLPHNKTLLFKSTFDGELIISKNSCIVDKQKVLADKRLELDGLSYGVSVQITIGLDIIWEIDFKKQQPIIADNEAEIMKQIGNLSGVSIPAPHSLRNILTGMGRYPRICQWIRKCIEDGAINERSYRRLQGVYRNISANKQGGKL